MTPNGKHPNMVQSIPGIASKFGYHVWKAYSVTSSVGNPYSVTTPTPGPPREGGTDGDHTWIAVHALVSRETCLLGVFTLVTRGWAASEFLTRVSKFNMTPNGEHQIIGPDRSQIFDARVTNVKTLVVTQLLCVYCVS